MCLGSMCLQPNRKQSILKRNYAIRPMIISERTEGKKASHLDLFSPFSAKHLFGGKLSEYTYCQLLVKFRNNKDSGWHFGQLRRISTS